ncbi:MAG TPA: hypothetical protein VLF68_03600 [Candidatus Saccharimonadales bacterium]|nr:hypothetical protein [Candidatus Saccharimonadales bacterium]
MAVSEQSHHHSKFRFSTRRVAQAVMLAGALSVAGGVASCVTAENRFDKGHPHPSQSEFNAAKADSQKLFDTAAQRSLAGQEVPRSMRDQYTHDNQVINDYNKFDTAYKNDKSINTAGGIAAFGLIFSLVGFEIFGNRRH